MNVWADRPDFSALAVLVVEDDADSRDLLREVLQSCGATVVDAEDVVTAQRYVSTVKLDLIVTDLALPGADGASFLKWLREQPSDRAATCPRLPSPHTTNAIRPQRSAAGRRIFRSRSTSSNS